MPGLRTSGSGGSFRIAFRSLCMLTESEDRCEAMRHRKNVGLAEPSLCAGNAEIAPAGRGCAATLRDLGDLSRSRSSECTVKLRNDQYAFLRYAPLADFEWPAPMSCHLELETTLGVAAVLGDDYRAR